MRKRIASIAFALQMGFSLPAFAGTLLLPAVLDKGAEPQQGILRLDRPVSGEGTVTLRWQDGLGRLVDERQWPAALDHATDIPFTLDATRAVTAMNSLSVSFEIGQGGAGSDRAEAKFAVPPWDDDWWDYQILIWQEQSAEGYRALKSIGISGAKLMAKDRPLSLTDGLAAALLAQDLRWYEENIATDFFAAYHRWFPDKPPNWKYLAAKAEHAKEPASLAPFMRDPSLSDPHWLAGLRERLTRVVDNQKPFRPLFYNLGDETGIADLAAYWDFDYSPPALAAFRRDLEARYGSLAVLNRQWASHFSEWDEVLPATAAEVMRRKDGNYASWADFRAWMDRSFADALAAGRDAVHQADPKARAAIEGGQVPGWGGYDYALLAPVVDVFELYDLGGNIDLVRSFNPKAAILTTSFGSGPAERRRVWRELLRGGRGVVLWDETSDFAHRDGSLGERGKMAADYFTEIRRGVGALLINGEVPPPEIAIHYSPASMRADWIAEMRRMGPRGLEQASHPDHPPYDFTRLRQALCDGLTGQGRQLGFLSSEQIELGALTEARAPRVLILPRSIALSDAEIVAIRRFSDQGGHVLALDMPGLFDEHVRRRQDPALAAIFARPKDAGNLLLPAGDLIARGRASAALPARLTARISAWLEESGVASDLLLTDRDNGRTAQGVEVTRLKAGAVEIVGLLGRPAAPQTGFGNRNLRISLGKPACAYDVRMAGELGCKQQFDVTVRADEPVILALAPEPIPPLSVSMPDGVSPGGRLELRVTRQDGPAESILHMDVVDPDGRSVPYYSRNLKMSGGAVMATLPLALNEQTGTWSVNVTDVLTGRRQDHPFHVVRQ